jgi:hypothetical protein
MPQLPAKAISSVVTGRNSTIGNQLLYRLECPPEKAGVIHVRGLVAHLTEDMGQGRSTEPMLAAPKIDIEQLTGAGELQVRCYSLGDVWTGSVRRDNESTGRLYRLLLTGLPGGVGGHGETVLAAVNGDPEFEHDVAHGHCCVMEGSTLSGEFRCPHPIAGALDVFERAHACPDDISERLAHTHASHRRRVHEPLYRLLADGRCGTCLAEVALGDDPDIRDRELKRAGALLLRQQPGHAPIHLGSEKSLRSDRK